MNPIRRSRLLRLLRRVLLGAVTAVAALVALFDWTWLRPVIQHVVQQRSGRQIDFETLRITLDGGLRPTFYFRQIVVQNASWAASPAPLLKAVGFGVTLSWQSLFGPRTVISRMTVEGAEIDLERQADGLRNWRLTNPQDRGAGRFRVLSLDARQARLRFLHRGLDLDVVLSTGPAAEAGAAAAVAGHPELKLTKTLHAEGSRHGVSFVGDGSTSELLTFHDTGQPFAVRADVRTAQARLGFDGIAQDLAGASDVDADIRLDATGWAEIAALLGSGPPMKAPLRQAEVQARAQAHLRKDGELWDFTALKAEIGRSDVAGRVSYRQHSPRPDAERTPDRPAILTASLHSDRIDRADLRLDSAAAPWEPRPSSAPAAGTNQAASAPVGGTNRNSIADAAGTDQQSNAPVAGTDQKSPVPVPVPVPVPAAASALVREALLPVHRRFAALDRLDATLDWDVASVHGLARLPIERLHLRAALHDRHATLAPIAFVLAGGQVGGRIELDASQSPPAASADLNLADVDLAQFGAAQVTGRVGGQVALASSGDSLGALTAGARGTVKVALAHATLPAALDAKLALDGGRWLRSKVTGGAPVAVTCSVFEMRIDAGVGRIRRLALVTANLALAGSGSVDLAQRSMDLMLTPHRRQAALLALDDSIHVSGPIAKPVLALVARDPRSRADGCTTATTP